MEVNIVDKSEYRNVISDLFSEDELLISKYHVNFGKGLESCIDRTESDFKSFDSFKLYSIKNNNEIVAFFGKQIVAGNTFMTGFFIKLSHRTKDFILNFWNIVKETIKAETLYSCVFENNLRAIDFLSKKGSIFGKQNNIVIFKIY